MRICCAEARCSLSCNSVFSGSRLGQQPTRLSWFSGLQTEYLGTLRLHTTCIYIRVHTQVCAYSLLILFLWRTLPDTNKLYQLYVSMVIVVQLLSRVRLFVTPWTAAHQASLSITNSWSLLKLMSIESMMLSNHLILCHPLLLPPSIFPSIRVFSSV